MSARLRPRMVVVSRQAGMGASLRWLAARWHAAGNHAEVVICPESVHGFIAFPNDIGTRSLAQQVGFLKRQLAFASA